MLIIGDNRDLDSGAEVEVLGWLHEADFPGIIVWGGNVPARRKHRPAHRAAVSEPEITGTGRESDFIYIGPFGADIVEVKGAKTATKGVLHCTVKSRWRLDGLARGVDPIHVRASDTNPFDQVKDYRQRVKNLIHSKVGRTDIYLRGLVLIVPLTEDQWTLDAPDTADLPEGDNLLLTKTPAPLLDWLIATQRGDTVCDIEFVERMVTALGFDVASELEPGQLEAAGFAEAGVPAPALPVRATHNAAVATLGAPPGLGTELPWATSTPESAVAENPSAAIVIPERPVVVPVPARRQVRPVTVLAASAAVVFAASAGWSFLDHGHESHQDAPASGTAPVSAIVDPALPGCAQTMPQTPVVKACFPFQQGC
ncbi:nuclease-related domain-containing protein [Nocardia niigatensis]